MEYLEVEFSFNPLKIDADIVLAEVSELEFESFIEEKGKILAYAQRAFFDVNTLIDFEWLSLNQIKFKLKYIQDVNWNKEWENNFKPIEVNDECIVRATFHKPPREYKYDLLIEPKMSFGTGHHATTYLMLKNMFHLDFANKTVLDMGTGTGVLAVLAVKLGANNALAIDNNTWAYENAVENIKLNNCSEKITVEIGEQELIKDKSFDYILANINRNVILADLPYYATALKNSGTILISGIMEHDVQFIEEKSQEIGLKLKKKEQKNNWNLFVFTK